MVPLDGSIRAEVALPIAARLAKAQECELLLVHVVPRPQIIERQPLAQRERQLTEQLTSWNEAEAERYMKKLKSRLTYEADSRLLIGRNESDSLLDFIDDEDVDLVVASAHGYSGERLRPFGSVVTNLITYGSAHLFVIQDLAQGAIRPTRATIVARDQINGGERISSHTDRLALWNPA
jgi:nucleotide-binding universal stress UspA family protein